ncbi:hypothetical protein H8959_013197 [Pygathrix nigripes]
MEVPNVKDFQWKRLAPLPSRRVYCSLLETGGQVYAIGGCDDNGVPMDCFEVYSPEADQWTALPPLPTARAGVAVTALGKRIMVIGGVGTNQLPLKVVEMYSIDEGKWKKRSMLREAAMGISVTAKGKSLDLTNEGDQRETLVQNPPGQHSQWGFCNLPVRRMEGLEAYREQGREKVHLHPRPQ